MDTPRYQSQAQLQASASPQGFYPPAPPYGPVLSQGWPPPYQQQHDQRYDSCLSCLFKCSCCFHGTTSTYIRYLSMVLGALILLHGVIAIIIAGLAFSEAKNIVVNETAVKEMDLGNKRNGSSLPPTLSVYAYYFSLLPGFGERLTIWKKMILAISGGSVGGFLVAFFLTLLFEIVPGACIIVAAVLLKQVFCALSYALSVLWFTENVIEIVLIPIAIIGPVVAGPSACDSVECATIAVLGVVVKFLFLCMIYTCMAAGLTLWEQIRNGIYGPRIQRQNFVPALIPKAGSLVNAVTIADQTVSAAGTKKSIQEPVEQS